MGIRLLPKNDVDLTRGKSWIIVYSNVNTQTPFTGNNNGGTPDHLIKFKILVPHNQENNLIMEGNNLIVDPNEILVADSKRR